MKNLFIAISLILLLTACGETNTIVVDQEGKVIETKGFQGLVLIGGVPIDNRLDGLLYQDTRTGCKYMSIGDKFSAYYNANGEVDGCRNVLFNK